MKKGVIKISKKKITKEMFVNELVRLYNEFGKVNIKIWNEHTVYKGSCFNWYLHQYGKIRALLNEVGITYINYNELTEEQVLEKAKCIYQEYGYINKKGEIVIDGDYIMASDFSENLASVRKNNKWGYINKEGKM